MLDTPQQEIETLEAVMGSPRDPAGRAFAPLADALLRAGDLDRATTVVAEGVSKDPEFASGWIVAGRVHQEAGRTDEAAEAFRKASELDDENAVALMGLGALAEGRDDVEAALGFYRRALELDHMDSSLQDRVELLEMAPPATAAPVVEAEPDPEPVVDDAPDVEDSPAMDMGALAPEPEPETEDVPVMDMGALAPEPEPEVEVAPVMDMGALAPDPDPVPEDAPVMDMGALAPDPEPVAESAPVEDPVFMDMGALAPDPVAEEAPSDDAEFMSMDALAPEPTGDPADGEMLTRSMGEVFAQQGLVDQAIDVYEKLVARDPTDVSLQARLDELKGGTSVADADDELISIDSLAPDA